jgi:hypothetical protein
MSSDFPRKFTSSSYVQGASPMRVPDGIAAIASAIVV